MNTPATNSVPRIEPDGIYSDGDLRLLLGLTSASLTRARRDGRLRYSRQGHRLLHRGCWVIDWLEADAKQAKGQGGGHDR